MQTMLDLKYFETEKRYMSGLVLTVTNKGK